MTLSAYDVYTRKKSSLEWIKHTHNKFYIIYSVADLGAMATPNDMITLSFTTVAGMERMLFFAEGTPGWRLRFIEGKTGGGASPTGSLDILNANRNSDKTSTIVDLQGTPVANKMSYDATLFTGGTTLWDEYIEGASGVGLGGNFKFFPDGQILKAATSYQLSLYGTDNNAGILAMCWTAN